jgi:hypothetical protein
MRRFALLFLGFVTLALAGCGSRAFGNLRLQTESIDAADVARTIQFVESSRLGPQYELSFTVPSGWVGQFQTRNRGNSLAVEFVSETGRVSPIFTIDALSNAQYWEQVGSFPGDFNAVLNTADTYFVYHLPQFSFYSGLPAAQYQSFADAVPAVIASIQADRAS